MALVEAKYWTEVTDRYMDDPARALARALHYCAMEGFHAHDESLRPVFETDNVSGSQMMTQLYSEYLVLFMHLTNRTADGMFGPENVREIQSQLLPYIGENAQAYYEGDIRSIVQTLGALANERERDYSSCSYFLPDKPDYRHTDTKATLYVFEKHIARVLGKDIRHPIDLIEVSTSVTNGLLSFNFMLNLSEWLKGLAITGGIATYESIDLAPPGAKS